MANNQLCKVLEIKKPIIQGPMAWISTAPLVAAVSETGALGVLGVGFAPPEFIKQQIAETRRLTKNPFGINVILIEPMLDSVTAIIQEEKPPVVYADSLEGLEIDICKKYFPIWKACHCKIIVKVCTIADAITAEKGGADVVIVKGWEGGGHVSVEATTVLVPQAADVLSIPIVASGGIADGRGMAAAIALGADGIEMGTIFMCAEETIIHPNAKRAVLEAGDMDTVITGYYTGEPCRQIKNKLSDDLLEMETRNAPVAVVEQIKAMAEKSLKKAMMDGDCENGAVMAGQIAPLITESKKVEEIIKSILAECKEVFEKTKDYSYS